MQLDRFNTRIKNLSAQLLSWIDLDSKSTLFIIGATSGALAVIVVLECLNVMHWVKYFPNWLVASTALLGILMWKKKLSYERNMGVVDDFHDAVHNFILKIGSSIQVLEILKISIQSYEEIFKMDPHRQKNFTCGLQEFIENSGEFYSSQLKNILDDFPIQHIYILSTKIDALDMKDSGLALSCYRQLNWVYMTVKEISSMLGMKSLYWKNTKILEMMSQLNEFDIDQLKKSLKTGDNLMLAFARKNYK